MIEQNNTRKYKIIVTALMIMALSVGLLSTYLTANPEYILIETVTSDSSTNIDNAIGLTVIVEHYRDSKLLSKQEKENDIFLKNFGSYLAHNLKGNDIDSFAMYDNVAGIARYQAQATSLNANSRIYIGSGSTAPALTDWGLETTIEYDEVMQVQYTVVGSQMNITMAISFGITGSDTVREVGYTNMIDSGTMNYHFLMARDILGTPVSVISGDILTVKYVMMFN